MKRPVIGLTSRSTNGPTRLTGVSRAYLAALEGAGAAPLIVPLGLGQASWRALFERLDGVLIPGGGDIGLQRLGVEGPLPSLKETSEERDVLEFTLVRWAVDEGRPILGICRGAQVMNVALGGDLYGDIASESPQALKHNYFPGFPRAHIAHPVSVSEETMLANILGAPIVETNSLHHQAVKTPAPGLEVVARAPDGIIEALEVPGHRFALGVQWHPEWLQHRPEMRNLFAALVKAAGVDNG